MTQDPRAALEARLRTLYDAKADSEREIAEAEAQLAASRPASFPMDSGVVERLGTLLLDEDLPFGAHDVVEAAIARIAALEGELAAAREALGDTMQTEAPVTECGKRFERCASPPEEPCHD